MAKLIIAVMFGAFLNSRKIKKKTLQVERPFTITAVKDRCAVMPLSQKQASDKKLKPDTLETKIYAKELLKG